MLSDKSYAKYFGENLIAEIFHLDEELTQARSNRQNPLVEEELERSFTLALTEAENFDILGEENKKPEKFHIYSAFGGKLLSSHKTEASAHKAASKHSHKQPVHLWTAGDSSKPVAQYTNGQKTTYEEFEHLLNTELGKIIGD